MYPEDFHRTSLFYEKLESVDEHKKLCKIINKIFYTEFEIYGSVYIWGD